MAIIYKPQQIPDSTGTFDGEATKKDFCVLANKTLHGNISYLYLLLAYNIQYSCQAKFANDGQERER